MADDYSKALALKEEEMNALVNTEDTGVEMQRDIVFPKEIKVLQSDKQYAHFEDNKDLQAKLYGWYGKLYLYEKEAVLGGSDLQDKIVGTLLKTSYGHVVYEQGIDGKADKSKFSYMAPGLILRDQRDDWMEEHPGLMYQNRVKVVLSLFSSEETTQMMKIGDNPYVVLTIEGSKWKESWFPVSKRMKKAIAEDDRYPTKSILGTAAPVFVYSISSRQVENEQGAKYYVPEIEVSTNDPAVAHAFIPIWEGWKKVHLFGNDNKALVNEDIEPDTNKVPEEEVKSKRDEQVDPDDLPF